MTLKKLKIELSLQRELSSAHERPPQIEPQNWVPYRKHRNEAQSVQARCFFCSDDIAMQSNKLGLAPEGLSGPPKGLPGPKPGPGPGQILEVWEARNPEIWNPKRYQKWKFSKSKSMSPNMLARSGLPGKKKTFQPHMGPFQTVFADFPWWANGPYSPGGVLVQWTPHH